MVDGFHVKQQNLLGLSYGAVSFIFHTVVQLTFFSVLLCHDAACYAGQKNACAVTMNRLKIPVAFYRIH